MSRGLERLRRWLMDAARAGSAEQYEDIAQTLRGLNRRMGELEGLWHQQAGLTVEALRRAGWESDEGVADQNALHKALRLGTTGKDIVVGPWTGEVGFELLYWIPFLAWLTKRGVQGERMLVISRGGAAPWYRHLTSRYVDILDVVTAEEFRTSTAGPKKQREKGREFDQEIVKRVTEAAGLRDFDLLHPSVMYRLFINLWRRRATVDLVEEFTEYHPLSTPDPDGVPDLPPDYVAAKFYFSKAFPDSGKNRAFVADLLGRVSRRRPVVLLSAGLRLDEHADFRPAGGSGLVVIDPHKVPQKNLEVQTRIVSGARGFIGTYGGFSYLAPFCGVRSLSFFSRRTGFEKHHLDLADRVFDTLLPGGFLAVDRRAADLVEPALERWTNTPARVPSTEAGAQA